MKCVLVRPDLSVEIVKLSSPTYKCLHDLVGGLFEIVRSDHLKKPYVMVVNESGLLLDLPVNLIGSFYYGTLFHGCPLVGNVVFMREGPVDDGEYDLLGLSDFEAVAFQYCFQQFTKKL